MFDMGTFKLLRFRIQWVEAVRIPCMLSPMSNQYFLADGHSKKKWWMVSYEHKGHEALRMIPM